MTFIQFFSILRARWKVALAILFATVALTVGISLMLPKQYTATASVVADPKPDPVSAVIYPGLPSPAYVATQIDIIMSDRVAQRVVRNLKLADNPQIRAQWMEDTHGEGSVESWLANALQAKMDVKPSRESNVITVAYKAPDPKFAAAIANAFVQAYVDVSVEMRVEPAKQYSAFFDTRAKEARDALEKAQTKLSAYQKSKGIIATDERLDVENARLNELSTQLVALQALSAESAGRQSQATGAAASNLSDVLNNALIGGLKSDLARQEAKFQELSSRLGDANPQVIELKANIAELRSRLDQETRKITSGVGLTNNINRSREAQVRADLDAQREKLLHLKQVRDESAVLERDVESAQKAYEAVVMRLNQSSLESQTTQANVMLLSQATPPVEPSSPKVLLYSALSLFVGTLLAVGVALVLELADRRVRAVEDAVAAIGVPVLGVLPKPGTRGQRSHRFLMQRRVLGQLPSPQRGA